MKRTHLSAVLAVCAMAATQVSAAVVVSIGPASGNQVVTFDEVGVAPGTSRDGIFTPPLAGVSFAERFVNQAKSTDSTGAFDVLAASIEPLSTLTLLPPQSDIQQNLTVLTPLVTTTAQALAGLGTAGLFFDGIGEGSIAMLFGQDQFEFGFDIRGVAEPIGQTGGNDAVGTATLDFFSADGMSIGRFILGGGGQGDPGLSNSSYKFSFNGASVRGVSIFNADPGGIAFDNVRYTVQSNGNGHIPEPGSLALSGLALLGLAVARRRKA